MAIEKKDKSWFFNEYSKEDFDDTMKEIGFTAGRDDENVKKVLGVMSSDQLMDQVMSNRYADKGVTKKNINKIATLVDIGDNYAKTYKESRNEYERNQALKKVGSIVKNLNTSELEDYNDLDLSTPDMVDKFDTALDYGVRIAKTREGGLSDGYKDLSEHNEYYGAGNIKEVVNNELSNLEDQYGKYVDPDDVFFSPSNEVKWYNNNSVADKNREISKNQNIHTSSLESFFDAGELSIAEASGKVSEKIQGAENMKKIASFADRIAADPIGETKNIFNAMFNPEKYAADNKLEPPKKSDTVSNQAVNNKIKESAPSMPESVRNKIVKASDVYGNDDLATIAETAIDRNNMLRDTINSIYSKYGIEVSKEKFDEAMKTGWDKAYDEDPTMFYNDLDAVVHEGILTRSEKFDETAPYSAGYGDKLNIIKDSIKNQESIQGLISKYNVNRLSEMKKEAEDQGLNFDAIITDKDGNKVNAFDDGLTLSEANKLAGRGSAISIAEYNKKAKELMDKGLYIGNAKDWKNAYREDVLNVMDKSIKKNKKVINRDAIEEGPLIGGDSGRDGVIDKEALSDGPLIPDAKEVELPKSISTPAKKKEQVKDIPLVKKEEPKNIPSKANYEKGIFGKDGEVIPEVRENGVHTPRDNFAMNNPKPKTLEIKKPEYETGISGSEVGRR